HGLLQLLLGRVGPLDGLQEHPRGAGVDLVAAAVVAEVVGRRADLDRQRKVRADHLQRVRLLAVAGAGERHHRANSVEGRPTAVRGLTPPARLPIYRGVDTPGSPPGDTPGSPRGTAQP